MAQQNSTLPLILSLVVTGGIVGGGFWFLSQTKGDDGSPVTTGTAPAPSESPTPAPNAAPNPAPNAASETPAPEPAVSTGLTTPFPAPEQVASGTQVFIDGSTSMVGINTALKQAFESKFPGTRVERSANGSSNGIEALIAGQVDIAASSRPLTPQEAQNGLQTVAIAPDEIALVVSKENPFRQSLTSQQVADIFTGKLNNWSEVGGPDAPIRVINRPSVSGTYSSFKELVLNGQDVTGPGVTTMERDETTGVLRQLGADGIGYATYSQVANQNTVRPLAVDNTFPNDPNYAYKRELLYVYKEPASDAVKAFLGFAGSPEGQQAIAQ